MRRIGILTSGGDAPGMNAAIRALTRACVKEGVEVLGFMRGYEGLLEGDYVFLDDQSCGGILQRGGTILKSSRCDEFATPEGLKKSLRQIEKAGLDYLVTIGGDGTFRGALDLSREGVAVMGLPATIDNDMGYTDFTIGFDTAVNTVVEAMAKIKDTGSAHERLSIIEVMGRTCGDIALYSGITGGAEYILIPEEPMNMGALVERIEDGARRGKTHCLIVKAEGVPITNDELMATITERTNLPVRQVILGYIQRGGSPTVRDRLLATRMGAYAVKLMLRDEGSRAIGISGNEITAWELDEAVAVARQADLSLMEIFEDLQ